MLFIPIIVLYFSFSFDPIRLSNQIFFRSILCIRIHLTYIWPVHFVRKFEIWIIWVLIVFIRQILLLKKLKIRYFSECSLCFGSRDTLKHQRPNFIQCLTTQFPLDFAVFVLLLIPSVFAFQFLLYFRLTFVYFSAKF